MFSFASSSMPPVTAAEFLASTKRLGPGKHVLIDGVVHVLPPASPTHACIHAHLAFLLGNHLDAHRSSSRVMISVGLQPSLRSSTNICVSDLVVSSGVIPGPFDVLAVNPRVIIEVTAREDEPLAETSHAACSTIASVKEMLSVDSERQVVQHWRRDITGAWPAAPELFATGQCVQLSAIGLTLSLEDIYAGTHLAGT